MSQAINTATELTQDQMDALRGLLDSEVVLIGGGEFSGLLN